MDEHIPVLSTDLIKKLDSLFPLGVPALGTSEQELWFKFGQRSVVEYLKTLEAQQSENILE